MSDAEISTIDKLLKGFENEVGWPKRPRRTLNIIDTISNESVFSVGLKFNLLGANLESSVGPRFAMDLKTTIVLIRTSKEGGEQIMTENENKELVLNHKPGVDFVYFCSYSAGVKAGMAWESKLGIIGASTSNTTQISETIEVTQGSQFVKVSENDSLLSIKKNCHDIFVNKVRKNVVKDLRKAIQTSVGFNSKAPDSPIELISKAANEGPEFKNAVFEGVTFNIPKADIVKKQGAIIEVKGKIIRHRKLVGSIPTTGLNIAYHYKFKDGAIIENKSFSDPKEEVALRLVEKIAYDLYNNNREEID